MGSSWSTSVYQQYESISTPCLNFTYTNKLTIKMTIHLALNSFQTLRVLTWDDEKKFWT
jgi:hypothetical protein